MGGEDGSDKGKSAAALPPSNSTVKLCIKSQDGEEYYYRVGRERRMIYVILKYCEEKNVDFETLRFVCNGCRIKTSLTPAQLGMEDGDIIDAMSNQHGGGN